MYVVLLEAVKAKYVKHDVGRIRITGEFNERRVKLPKKTIYGKWIWPGQTVWQYRHTQICLTGNMGVFYKWVFLYMTAEEYTMAKLEN